MLCIKTGCTAYLDPYGEVVHGDLFAFSNNFADKIENGENPLVLMRISTRDIGGSFSHAFISKVDQWFDESAGVSTLVGRMSAFDYDGLRE